MHAFTCHRQRSGGADVKQQPSVGEGSVSSGVGVAVRVPFGGEVVGLGLEVVARSR